MCKIFGMYAQSRMIYSMFVDICRYTVCILINSAERYKGHITMKHIEADTLRQINRMERAHEPIAL